MTGLANDFGQLKGLGHTIAMLPNTRQTSPQDRKPPFYNIRFANGCFWRKAAIGIAKAASLLPLSGLTLRQLQQGTSPCSGGKPGPVSSTTAGSIGLFLRK
jgi:hypothetical protein